MGSSLTGRDGAIRSLWPLLLGGAMVDDLRLQRRHDVSAAQVRNDDDDNMCRGLVVWYANGVWYVISIWCANLSKGFHLHCSDSSLQTLFISGRL